MKGHVTMCFWTVYRGHRGGRGGGDQRGQLGYQCTCLGCSHIATHSFLLRGIRWSEIKYDPILLDVLTDNYNINFLIYTMFFLQLVKTADLDPRHNYVFGFHPHGVLVAGAFTNFCTYATGFRKLFPGITSYMLMLPLWFRAPFFRDYIMLAGLDFSITLD